MRTRRFFPLDQKLGLRADHCSPGLARVAVREGLQARSFQQAAEAVSDAVGGSISADSVRRLTEGFGEAVGERRAQEAERAARIADRSEQPGDRRLPGDDPVGDQGNVSTDGAMVLVRHEGWKEAKLTTISAVASRPVTEQREKGRRVGERDVALSRHSYQAGLWDADTLGRYQYAEALRRGVDRCATVSVVNDGALWIERVTGTNFPEAVQVVDWPHASERVWDVGKAVFGEGSAATDRWVEARLDALWEGRVAAVITDVEALGLTTPSLPAPVRQAPGYFRHNQARMDYPTYRRDGYPIGSGTVESGANTLVHHRLRRPGRGWARDGANAMLAGLAELHSNRFLPIWHSLGVTPL